MPIAKLEGDNLVVLTERKDLGYGRGHTGNWWALRAFGAMCDQQIDLPHPYTQWIFPASLRLAVERILKERGRELTVLSKPEFDAERSRLMPQLADESMEGRA